MDGRSLDELYEDIENDGHLVSRMWEQVQENAHNWDHEPAYEYAEAALDAWMFGGELPDELDEWWD